MRARTWTRMLAAFGLALAALMSLGSCERKQNEGQEEITLGVILPLTGDAAVYGKALRNGIDLAKSVLESANGVKLSLIYEDDQGQATAAVSAVRKLIDVHKVPAIIGGAQSSTAEAIIPICDRAHVVLLSPTATKPSLTSMSDFFFRLWPSDDYDGKVMAEAAYHKLGLRRVSIIYINVAYGVGISEVFGREFRQLGGTIIAEDGYKQGETNFRTVLTKLRAANPEAVFLPGYVAEISQIFKQARELDVRVRFLGVNSLYDPKLIEIAGSAAEGAVFSYPTYDPDSEEQTIASFVTAFRSRFDSVPDAFGAQGYDSLSVIHLALQRLGKAAPTGSGIAKALLELPGYNGPGGTVSFLPNGDVEKTLRLLTVRDGEFVPLEP